MTIKVLTDKGVSNREAARLLGVSEGTVRYHRRRMAAGAVDGRTHQQPLAAAWQEAIEAWLEARDEPSPSNVAELHAHLVAEHATLVIPVSCVEAGRWSWREQRFSTSGRAHFARGRARRVASVSACMAADGSRRSNQGEVWADIDERLDSLGVASATQAMEDAFEQRRESLEAYTRPFSAREGQTGALFAIDGKISGLDLFDCPATLEKLLPKLVRSHALDAIETSSSDKAQGEAEKARPQEFLVRLRDAQVRSMPAIGLGEDIRLSGEYLAGAALAYEDRLVHLCAFPLAGERGPGGRRHTRLRRASERFRMI